MGWLGVHSPEMEDRGVSVIPFLHIAGADKVGAGRGLCDRGSAESTVGGREGKAGLWLLLHY